MSSAVLVPDPSTIMDLPKTSFLRLLVGNDNKMILSWHDKMGLSLNSPKRCDVMRNFSFCCIYKSGDRGVPCPTKHDCWSHLFYFLLLQYFLFTNSNKKLNTTHNNHSSLTVLWGGTTKKSATTATMATDAAGHCGSYFSCGSPF